MHNIYKNMITVPYAITKKTDYLTHVLSQASYFGHDATDHRF